MWQRRLLVVAALSIAGCQPNGAYEASGGGSNSFTTNAAGYHVPKAQSLVEIRAEGVGEIDNFWQVKYRITYRQGAEARALINALLRAVPVLDPVAN